MKTLQPKIIVKIRRITQILKSVEKTCIGFHPRVFITNTNCTQLNISCSKLRCKNRKAFTNNDGKAESLSQNVQNSYTSVRTRHILATCQCPWKFWAYFFCPNLHHAVATISTCRKTFIILGKVKYWLSPLQEDIF